MLHVEELFTAINEFRAQMMRAGFRQDEIRKAQAEFRAFCEQHNLPIDFTERS